MLERTIIYVDTSYLLASFYNTWATGARAQLEIDLPEVVNVLECRAVNQLNQPVHRQNWYDGIPDSGPHRYQRALRSCPGVQLRAGQLIEWGDRRTQKAVDTRLVADMVLSSANREVTDIILVSGDADMLPGVEESVARGVRVHLYGFGWDSMSSNLRYACDTTTILDPREHFAECMRLEVLEGPLKAGGTAETTETTEPAEPAEPADTAETAEAAGFGEVTEPAGSDRAVTTATGETANTVTDQTTAPCQDDGTPESTGANGHSVRQHKPIGDAEPVEDLSGTSAVPDVPMSQRSGHSPGFRRSSRHRSRLGRCGRVRDPERCRTVGSPLRNLLSSTVRCCHPGVPRPLPGRPREPRPGVHSHQRRRRCARDRQRRRRQW